MSAVGVAASTASYQEAGPGSTPRTALQSIIVRPIPSVAAKKIIVKNHYLHSFLGCTQLCFGMFIENRLLGALTLGAGPTNAFRLVEGAKPNDCLTLTRLWLSEELPPNSESRVVAISLRFLKKYTKLKFLVTYADPTQGHIGIIYQAGGWLYTGLSEAMPKFDLGDGVARHSRSLSHAFGSHSLRYFSECGFEVKVLPQIPKHRYIYLFRQYLKVNAPILPYPKKENEGGVRGWGSSHLMDISPCTPSVIITGEKI
jgi:hypothetical protein